MENKCNCPEELVEGYARKLKVCGHPLRLKMLCLIERQDCCVSELWQCLDQPQPVISQHLAVLKDKGIVDSATEGNKRIYRIVDPFVQNIIAGFDGVLPEAVSS
jgi:DNA-binding transcriptional ArsR family regulator